MQILSWVASAMYAVYANQGGARHVAYLEPDQLALVAEFDYISLVPVILGIVIGKCAVSLLIYRLQPPTKWRTYLLWFLSVSSLVCAVLVIVLEFAQCTPVKALWIPTAGKCWNPKAVNNWDVAASGMFT